MAQDHQAYIDAQDARRREIAARIELLRAKAAKADAKARVAYQEQIERLEEKQDQFAEKLGELKQATGSAWEELREGVEKAWEDLSEGIRNAGEKIR